MDLIFYLKKTPFTTAEMEHMCQVRGRMGYALFSPAGPVALWVTHPPGDPLY